MQVLKSTKAIVAGTLTTPALAAVAAVVAVVVSWASAACLPGVVLAAGDGGDAPVTDFAVVDPAIGHRLSLSWVNPASADFTAVRILRREGGACPSSALDDQAAIVGEVEGTSHDDDGLANGEAYCYAAFALYAGGARLSVPAVEDGVPTDAQPPAPVTSLAAVADPSGEAVALSWLLPTGEPNAAALEVLIARKLDAAPASVDDGLLTTPPLAAAEAFTDNSGGFADGDHVFYAVFVRDDAALLSDAAVVDVVVGDITPPIVADAVNFAAFATGHDTAAVGIVPLPPPGAGDVDARVILARGPAGGVCPDAPGDPGASVVLDIDIATPGIRPNRIDDSGLGADTAYCYGFWLEDAAGNRSPTTSLPVRTSRGPLTASFLRGVGFDVAAGGSNNGTVVTDVAAFADGSVVVAGTYSGTLRFDAGAADDLTSGGDGSEVFVARVAANGAVVWTLSTSGMNAPGAASVAVVLTDTGSRIVLAADETAPTPPTPLFLGALQVASSVTRAFIATIDDGGTPLDGGALQAGASTDVRLAPHFVPGDTEGRTLLSFFNSGGLLAPVTFTSALGVTWSVDGPDGSAFALLVGLASDLSLRFSAFADEARVPFAVVGDNSLRPHVAASWSSTPRFRDAAGDVPLTVPGLATVILTLDGAGGFVSASLPLQAPLGFDDMQLADVDGDVVIAMAATASSGNTISFPSSPQNIALTQRGAADTYVARIDIDTGRALWATQLGDTGGVGSFVSGGAASALPHALAVDFATNGTVVVVAGEVDGAVFAGSAGGAALLEIGPATRTAFLLGLDVDDGAVRWLTHVSGSPGASNAARGATFAGGDVVVAGALGDGTSGGDGAFGGLTVDDAAFVLRFHE